MPYYGDGEDELNLAFNFLFVHADLEAEELRTIVAGVEEKLPQGAWPVYTGSNHDAGRLATRWAGDDPRRARLALLMLLTLRGTPFLYYGDELGLPEVRDGLADGARPGRAAHGRPDAATATAAARRCPGRPSRAAASPPPRRRRGSPFGDLAAHNVAAQAADPASTLNLDARPDRAAPRGAGAAHGRLRGARGAGGRLGLPPRRRVRRRAQPLRRADRDRRDRRRDRRRDGPRARRRGGRRRARARAVGGGAGAARMTRGAARAAALGGGLGVRLAPAAGARRSRPLPRALRPRLADHRAAGAARRAGGRPRHAARARRAAGRRRRPGGRRAARQDPARAPAGGGARASPRWAGPCATARSCTTAPRTPRAGSSSSSSGWATPRSSASSTARGAPPGLARGRAGRRRRPRAPRAAGARHRRAGPAGLARRDRARRAAPGGRGDRAGRRLRARAAARRRRLPGRRGRGARRARGARPRRRLGGARGGAPRPAVGLGRGGHGGGGRRHAGPGRGLPARLAALGRRAGRRGAAAAAERLARPDVLTAYGLRTLSSAHPALPRARLPPRRVVALRLLARLGRAARRPAAEEARRAGLRAGVLAALDALGLAPELYAVGAAGELQPVAGREPRAGVDGRGALGARAGLGRRGARAGARRASRGRKPRDCRFLAPGPRKAQSTGATRAAAFEPAAPPSRC